MCDNGSTDGADARVAADWPDATHLRMETNRGFAEACNAGVAAGDGDVVVLLNNDVDCRPDFLERVVAPLEADAGIGSVAALCIRPDGERIDSIGLTMDRTLSPFPRLQGRPVAEAAEPSSGPRRPGRAPPPPTGARRGGRPAASTSGSSPTARTSTSPCACAPRAGAPWRRLTPPASTSARRRTGTAPLASAATAASAAPT